MDEWWRRGRVGRIELMREGYPLLDFVGRSGSGGPVGEAC